MIPFFIFIFFFLSFNWGEGGGEDMSMKFKAWHHVVLIHLLTVISSFSMRCFELYSVSVSVHLVCL